MCIGVTICLTELEEDVSRNFLFLIIVDVMAGVAGLRQNNKRES